MGGPQVQATVYPCGLMLSFFPCPFFFNSFSTWGFRTSPLLSVGISGLQRKIGWPVIWQGWSATLLYMRLIIDHFSTPFSLAFVNVQPPLAPQ